ncbi:hypothetical protein JYT72_02990 [Crocinitomix catalasitica]|nr:hypothetical protein [Crocinitomix catalasitica]
MTVNVGGSITSFSKELEIGKGGTNQGKLFNYGTITVKKLEIKPNGGCLLGQPLPEARNYGTINTISDLHVGGNCGAGSLI